MTIDEFVKRLRDRGPTMDVPDAAKAIGVSRATLYAAIKTDQAPVRTIRVLGRVKVLTESVVALLEGRPDVTSGETSSDRRRSGPVSMNRTGSGVKRAPSAQPGCDLHGEAGCRREDHARDTPSARLTDAAVLDREVS